MAYFEGIISKPSLRLIHFCTLPMDEVIRNDYYQTAVLK